MRDTMLRLSHSPWRRVTRSLLPLALACAALLQARPAQAQRIRMATLVPEGSSWHNILKKMAADWKTLSKGRVKLIIYPGGVRGDDTDVVTKMRAEVLDAGVLTAVGVAKIDPSVYALGVPMMYSSYDEVYHVLEEMKPRLEANLAQAKTPFVVLNWADGGWNHFFAKKAVATPKDLKKLKLFRWAGVVTGFFVKKWFQPPSAQLSTTKGVSAREIFASRPGFILSRT